MKPSRKLNRLADRILIFPLLLVLTFILIALMRMI